MPFIYKLDTYPVEIYQKCENELPTLRLSKVIQIYIRTHTHTDTTKITYHAALRVVNKHFIIMQLSPS